ncbi:MAG: tetratricopeptide repeat protein [Candidatus Heimdallarchaeota archaeon]
MDFEILQRQIKDLIDQDELDEALSIVHSQLLNSKYNFKSIPETSHLDVWREKWQLQLLISEIFRIQWQYNEALALAEGVLKESRHLGQLTLDTQLMATIAKALPLVMLRNIKEALKLTKDANKFLESTRDSREINYERTAAVLELITAMAFFNLSKYREALNHFKNSLEILRQTERDDWLIGVGQIVESATYCEIGKFSDGIKRLKASAAYNEAKGLSYNLCLNLGVIANYHCEKGELMVAENFGLEALKFAEKKSKKSLLLATIHTILGRIYVARGELHKAEPLLLESVKISKSLESPYVFAPATTLGELYRVKGNYNRAITYLTEGLQAAREMGYRNAESWTLDSLGSVYRDKGEFQTASDILKKALTERKALGNHADTARTLFNLLLVALETKNVAEAKIQVQELKDLDGLMKNPIIAHRATLADALVLKHSPRIIDKAQAQEKLLTLTVKEDIEATIKILALLNLFDLLLLEWKVSEAEETLQEIHALLELIKTIAKSQEMISLIIETNLLQATVALIEGHMTQTDSLLIEAIALAKNHNLTHLIVKIQQLQNQITSQIQEWQALLKQNASIAQRMEKADLEDYLDAARKLVLSFD